MRDIVEDCENRIHSGQGNVAILINFNDIANVVRDASNRRIITDIVLAPGAKAYRLENIRNNPFTGSNTAVEVGDFRNTYTRTVAFFVPLDGWETSKEILDPIKDGKFVLIISNDWQHINSVGVVDNKYQVYGIDKGLFVSSMQQTRYENSDVWSIEMTETEVNNSGLWLRHTTEKDVEGAMVLSLTGDCTEGFTNPYTGEELPTADIINRDMSNDLGVSEFYFAQNGVQYHWISIIGAMTECGVVTQGSQLLRVIDDTCEFLNGLTEDKPVEP